MFLKFVKSDGNDRHSVASLNYVNLDGSVDTSIEVKVSLIVLGEAFNGVKHFKGFPEGQLFDISVKPVVENVSFSSITDMDAPR